MEVKRKIAITPHDPAVHEAQTITRLLEAEGFTDVHLRHPDLTAREMLKLIEEIPQRLHKRLHLHGHFDLINEFNLGGIHLNRRCPEPPAGCNVEISASCHSIEEAERCREAELAYVTLSPVFDSISKEGYRAAFSPEELDALNRFGDFPVIALGGVTPDNVTLLDRYNFKGYAMLGAIPWQKFS